MFKWALIIFVPSISPRHCCLLANISPNFPQLPSITKTQFAEKHCPRAGLDPPRVYDLFYLVWRDNFVTGDFKICRYLSAPRCRRRDHRRNTRQISRSPGPPGPAPLVLLVLSHIIAHYQIIVSKLEAQKTQ